MRKLLLKHRPSRTFSLVVGLAVCICATTPAAADLTLVRLMPAEPTEDDTVRVLVHGLFLDDCWSVPVFDGVDLEFDVEPSTSSGSTTWGRIRGLYR